MICCTIVHSNRVLDQDTKKYPVNDENEKAPFKLFHIPARRTYGADRDSHSNYSTECKVMHGRCDDD